MDSITKGGPSAGGTTNMMHIFQSCNDISDAVELFGPQQLYLKPVARLNVSVQLPQLKQPGKTISNWEVMERLKNMVKPTDFIVLKVSKSTLEFIRFEGEIESKSNLEGVVSRLDGRTIKLSGFSDLLKVRAAEAKASFPTRHSWDSYFRDAKNMNEMKPGERPDTIHITNLPCKWFSSKHDLAHGSDLPSEYIFRKVFEQFGEVRCVDIPLLDPYRNLMKAQISGMKTFSFGQGLAFEGYVQFQEYVCFVKAMDALRGMKLLHKEGDKAFTASIKVDFDKTKHLSETSIRRRRQEREHLMANEREIEERERRAKEAQEREAEALRNKEREKQQIKDERRRHREEQRKAKHLKKIKEEETRVMNKKIAIEERKLIIAQRKLESIRLLDELFERVKIKIQKVKSSPSKLQDAPIEDLKLIQGESNKEDLALKEKELRQRLLKKYKSIQETLLEEQREKLRRTVEGKTRLQSIATKPTEKDGSDSDSSSGRRSSSRRSDKNKKRNDNRRSNSADGRYDWFSGMPMSSLPPMDFTALVHAYDFQNRFPERFQSSYRDGFYRQRGRWQRYPRGRNVQPVYYGQWNEEYYKYFRKVAKKSPSRSISRSRTRSRSRSKRRSRSRSRRKTKSKSRSWSRRRTRSKSRSRSKSRTKSRSKSPRSRSKFDRSTPDRSRSRKSHPRSRNRSRSRSRSRSRGRKRSRTRSSENRRRSKSESRSRRRRSNSSRGRRNSKSNQSRSSSPRERSSRRSTSPRKRSSRSKSKNRSKERIDSKKSLRSLSRDLSLSLLPEVENRTPKVSKRSRSEEKDKKRSRSKEKDKKRDKNRSGSKKEEKKRSGSKEGEKKKSKKNKDSKNVKEKRKSK